MLCCNALCTMAKYIRAVYLVVGTLMEAVAWYSFFHINQTPIAWVIFLTCHGTSAYLFALMLLPSLPRRWQIRDSLWLLTLFNLFLPLIGLISLMCVLSIMEYLDKPKPRNFFKRIDALTPINFNTQQKARFGAGGAEACLSQKHLPTNIRSEAMLYLSAQNHPQAFQTISHYLNDNDDQIRLLAFSLLSQKEQALVRELNENKTKLERGRFNTRFDEAILHYRLAQLFWEHAYWQLARGELRQKTLKQARQHALHAKSELNDNPNLFILLGKIHLALDDEKEATNYFIQAHNKGGLDQRIVPYLADIAFRKGEWQQVHALLSKTGLTMTHTKLAQIISFWSGASHDTAY